MNTASFLLGMVIGLVVPILIVITRITISFILERRRIRRLSRGNSQDDHYEEWYAE